MSVKCTFCNDTKVEPGISGPCVWCEEIGITPSGIKLACAEIKAERESRAPICDCNQGREPCTCKGVTRYNTVQLRFATGDLAKAEYVNAQLFDQLKADRDSLSAELEQCQARRRQFVDEVNARTTVLDEQADAAQSELAALREELARAKQACSKEFESVEQLDNENTVLKQRLTAAEQRNVELEKDLAEEAENNKDLGAECTRTHKLLVTAELRNEVSLGLLSRALKVIQGMRYEKLEAEIVGALNLKPTESGASEEKRKADFVRINSASHCPECGHPDCNGQCYGDDMMGD